MTSSFRQIKILDSQVARKIAAGEVIDRPNAIVRELLDNAVDAGATQIDVEIYGGGIEKIRIADNGCGISKENLAIAARPHATSKIESDRDLLNLTTLGFRGEALASIAAVSRLAIASGQWKMRCSVTEDHLIEPSQEVFGTIVTSESLFENFPARRQFLKRASSETAMCKKTFLEKAMPRPDIAFRLVVDGEIRSDLISGKSLSKRFCSALETREPHDLFCELKSSSPAGEWNFSLVIGDASVFRKDRKDIFIFVNGRRISEYSLLQAIEYGAQGFFPNGTHPAAALFVQMRPDLVDFNIHPAKREARFKDIAELHHAVSKTVREFFNAYTAKTMKANFSTPFLAEAASENSPLDFEKKSQENSQKNSQVESNANFKNDFSSEKISFSNSVLSSAKNFKIKNSADFQFSNLSSFERPPILKVASPKNFSELPKNFSYSQNAFRYVGRALGTFILAEKNFALYAIDQHAAHERILFDKIMTKKIETQNLLVPLKIELESFEQENHLKKILEELSAFGFACEKCGECEWQFTKINSLWKGTGQELKALIFERGVEAKEIVRRVAATAACKAAVKDGDVLDFAAAEKLAREALDLPDPHCPHGRPVYTVFTRKEMFERVRRT